MSGPLVCVVGSLNQDTGLRVAALPKPGETVLASSRTTAPGGKGANQAVAAAALGGTVAMVGAVGTDAAGDQSLAALASRGVDSSAVRRVSTAATGSAVVVVDDSGENHIVVDAGANGEVAADKVVSAVGSLAPALLLLQLEVPYAAVAAAAQAAAGVTVVLNPAPMPSDPAQVLAMLAHVDVLVPNRAELGRLAGRPEPLGDEEVAACVDTLDFAGDVVVTMGSGGVYCFPAGFPADGEPVHLPAERVEVVDTSGAGDAFCGCLAVRLAAGDPLLDAVRAANRAAALSTTVPGAQLPADFTV